MATQEAGLITAAPSRFASDLTGFEDETTRDLILARQYLQRTNVPTLKPLLPLLLKLKGKPYRLHNYFAFEPFFRTRMSKWTLLKTGRQVSKCVPVDEMVLLADGRRIPAGQIKPGDVVYSYHSATKSFRPQRVSQVFPSGTKEVRKIVTQAKRTLRMTGDHRLLARDSDNHMETYLATKYLYNGDYLATRGPDGLEWDRVKSNYEDGEAETVDFEVETDHNYLLGDGDVVSHNSTSLAAQGIVFSNSIPFFSTLYVTPLFEMIRRFSHNYVRQFLEESPVRRLFLGSKTMNSVLQRTFKNGASMYFSYAFLDAERTRGIPADKNCLVAGTKITTAAGNVAIERVTPGTVVLSADKNGIVCKDIVTERIYQGVQDVFEVKLSNGASVRCTRDERFRGRDGQWITLGNLFAGRTTTQRSAVKLVAGTNALGLFVGRFGHCAVEPHGVVARDVPARQEAGCVLPLQGGGTGRVCAHPTDCQAQPRLGQMDCCVLDGVQPVLRRGGRSDDLRRHEVRDDSVDVSPRLGSRRVLGHGRRHAAGERHSPLHARVHRTRSQAAGIASLRHGSVVRPLSVCAGSTEDAVHGQALNSGFSAPFATYRELRTSEHAIQTGPGTPAGDLLHVSDGVRRPKGPGRSEGTCLRQEGMCLAETPNSDGAEPDGLATNGEEREGTKTVCGVAHIVSVTYVGRLPVWDINTAKEHAFFANGVLVHNCIDEVQDMHYDFLQIIHETLSGSEKWGLIQYAGTPKSLDNTIEKLWQDSSQAEWMMKCQQAACNHWNVPAASHDLLDMIGPYHSGISEECPGVVCAKCRKPLNPRLGRWVHAHRERRWTFAGYHVPQIIMPLHYRDPEKWSVLVGKSQGRNNTTPTTFLNEVCGESCDSGSKLVTQSDLIAAATLPWRPRAIEAKPHINKYVHRILAVDWGGGGGRLSNSAKKKGGEQQRTRTSFTTLAVLGMRPDGNIDVIWGHRSVRTHDFEYEAKLCLDAMTIFRCSHIVHDYSNAGEGRLVLLYQAGLSPSNIINMRYHGVGHNIMTYHEPTDDHPRSWYSLDKSRSLVTTCMCIKYGIIRFFKYDYQSADNPGLLHDFLSLIEEKVDSRLGTDVYTIVRNPNSPDDFAHSVNIGCCSLWWMTKRWPDIAEAAKMTISAATLKHIHPQQKVDWDDI